MCIENIFLSNFIIFIVSLATINAFLNVDGSITYLVGVYMYGKNDIWQVPLALVRLATFASLGFRCKLVFEEVELNDEGLVNITL